MKMHLLFIFIGLWGTHAWGADNAFPISDRFPLPVVATSRAPHSSLSRITRLVEESKHNPAAPYFYAWQLNFFFSTVDDVLSKYFSSLSEMEKTRVLRQLEIVDFLDSGINRGRCRLRENGQNRYERCQLGKTYDLILLPAIIPDLLSGQIQYEFPEDERSPRGFSSSPSAPPPSVLRMPTALYQEIIEKKASLSFDLEIKLSMQTPPSEILRAAQYLEGIFTREEIVAKLNQARKKGGLSVLELFPDFFKERAQTFGPPEDYNCHLTAHKFVTPLWRPDDYANMYSQKYFSELSPGNDLRFGDLLRFGWSHVAVYLMSGFVFMKDNPGAEWPYRLARIEDIYNSPANHQYAPMETRVITHAFRRNAEVYK